MKNGKFENAKCLNCDAEFRFHPSSAFGKYCSNKCQKEYNYKTDTLKRFYEGIISQRKTLKRILEREIQDTCFECDINEWMGKPISLQLDHIDGDAGNNKPDNLRLLCPNCHSQTETFTARNKGNGRGTRGLKR